MLSLNPKHSLLKNKTNPELSSRFVLFVYGAGGRTRTGTSLRTRDFKSLASTIPPHQHLEVPPGFEPGNEGFADPCLTTWLWYHSNFARLFYQKKLALSTNYLKFYMNLTS